MILVLMLLVLVFYQTNQTQKCWETNYRLWLLVLENIISNFRRNCCFRTATVDWEKKLKCRKFWETNYKIFYKVWPSVFEVHRILRYNCFLNFRIFICLASYRIYSIQISTNANTNHVKGRRSRRQVDSVPLSVLQAGISVIFLLRHKGLWKQNTDFCVF